MSIQELIQFAREDYLDDWQEPYVFSDAKLTRYLNQAIAEACTRAGLLEKTKTVPVLDGTRSYILDPYCRKLLLVELADGYEPLTQSTEAQLTIRYGANWRDHTGAPIHYLRNGTSLTLFPIPVAADTLTYTAKFLPDATFDVDTDLDPGYYDGLLYWVAFRALMNPNSILYKPELAKEFLRLFDEKFGLPKSAKFNSVSQTTPLYGTSFGGRMC